MPLLPESVQIPLEASATALRNFYSTSLSAGVSNVLKILQTNIIGMYLLLVFVAKHFRERPSQLPPSPCVSEDNICGCRLSSKLLIVCHLKGLNGMLGRTWEWKDEVSSVREWLVEKWDNVKFLFLSLPLWRFLFTIILSRRVFT